MDLKMKRITWLVLSAVVLFAALLHLDAVGGFFLMVLGLIEPVLVGGVLAFLLNVPMNGIEHGLRRLLRRAKKAPKDSVIRSCSLLLTLISILLVFFLVGTLVVPQLVASVANIYDTLREKVPLWIDRLAQEGKDTAWLAERLESLDLSKLAEKLTSNAGSLLSSVMSAASSTVGMLTSFVIGIVLAVYMLANKHTLARQSKKLMQAYLSPRVSQKICGIGTLINRTFSKFLSGQCVESVLLGLMILVAYSVFGLPYAIVVAVMTAFFSFIPYIGSFLACFVGMLLIFMVDPMKALISLPVFLAVQFIEGQFLYPRVVGNSVGLSPMWTLIAALLGGKLFGVVGMIFFIPITAVLYTLVRDYTNRRLEARTHSSQ